MQKIARFKWPILSIMIGFGLNMWAVFHGLSMFSDTGTSFVGPGETSITITNGGNYTLWHETKGMIDGQFMSFPDDLPDGTIIKILKQPEGNVVPLSSSGNIFMESGGKRRVSIGQLTFTSPGQYKVVVEGLTGKRAFYLGEAKFLQGFLKVFVYGMVGAMLLFVGIGSGIYILVKSSKRPASSAD